MATIDSKSRASMRRTYTQEQLDQIRQRYPNEETKVISESMGIKVASIYNLAYKLGLKKTEEYFMTPESGRLMKGTRNGIAGEFKKGNVPHNKGKKMPAELYAKCRPTMFQKGSIPSNLKPIGYLSVRPDKTGREYVHIKVDSQTWNLYHRVLWEQEHGPIPAKMKIVFINGNTLDCRLDNLKMVTYQEAMLMNTIHRYTPEIKQLIRLNNKLKQKLNGKEQNQ
jgi:hypothetical protein